LKTLSSEAFFTKEFQMINRVLGALPALIVGAMLLCGSAGSAQRRVDLPKPANPMPQRIAQVLTAMPVSTSAAFTPECDVVTYWDNIKKQNVTAQNGKVRFRMVGTAPAGTLVTDGNWMVPFAANQKTPGMDVAGSVILTANSNWDPLNTPLSVNGTFYLFGGNPVVSFNWPTGIALWKNYRWATNRCNNVPVGPLTATTTSAILNDIKNASSMTATTGLTPVDVSGTMDPIKSE
jgi:hypothetical protein